MARYAEWNKFIQNLKTDKYGETNVNEVGIAFEKATADVVPKSEVEATVEKLMSATDKVICEAKTEVAREIFEEIEKALFHLETPIGKYLAINRGRLAELKKKYTEGEE